MISDVEKNEIKKYLNDILISDFEKSQIRLYLEYFESKDIISLLNDIEVKSTDEIVINKIETKVEKKFTEDDIKEIVKLVKSQIKLELKVKQKSTKEIFEELKLDDEFLSFTNRVLPVWGSGGFSKNDIVNIINEQRPKNPYYFGDNLDGNWRIVQDGADLVQEYKYGEIWIPQCTCSAGNIIDNLILTEDINIIETEDDYFLVL